MLLIKAKESPYGKRNSQVIFLLNTQHHMATYRKLATSAALAIFYHMLLCALYFLCFAKRALSYGVEMSSLSQGRKGGGRVWLCLARRLGMDPTGASPRNLHQAQGQSARGSCRGGECGRKDKESNRCPS